MNYTINPETLKYYGRNIVAGAALPATSFYDVANKIANTGNMLLGGDNDIFDTGATDRTTNWAKSGNYVQSKGLPTYYGIQPSRQEQQVQQPNADPRKAPRALAQPKPSKNQEAPAKPATAIPRMGTGGHGYMEWGGKKHYVDDASGDGYSMSAANGQRNMAINEANERFANEQRLQESVKNSFRDQKQDQLNYDSNIGWALNNPNAPNAQAFLAQHRQGRKMGEQISPDMLTADFMARYRDAESKRGMQNAQAGHYGALANMQNVTAGLLPRTTEANIGHIGAQDRLVNSQIQDADIKRYITQKALAGDPAALAMLGKTSRQDQAYMHAVEGANKLTDEEARNAALQNAWYAREGYIPKTIPAIPESGSLWWKKPAQKATLIWEPPTRKQG